MKAKTKLSKEDLIMLKTSKTVRTLLFETSDEDKNHPPVPLHYIPPRVAKTAEYIYQLVLYYCPNCKEIVAMGFGDKSLTCCPICKAKLEEISFRILNSSRELLRLIDELMDKLYFVYTNLQKKLPSKEIEKIEDELAELKEAYEIAKKLKGTSTFRYGKHGF